MIRKMGGSGMTPGSRGMVRWPIRMPAPMRGAKPQIRLAPVQREQVLRDRRRGPAEEREDVVGDPRSDEQEQEQPGRHLLGPGTRFGDLGEGQERDARGEEQGEEDDRQDALGVRCNVCHDVTLVEIQVLPLELG